MKTEPLDFIGIDYAVDNRNAEEVILPLAKEEGIGVLVYVPFGRSRLFTRVGDRRSPIGPAPSPTAGASSSSSSPRPIRR